MVSKRLHCCKICWLLVSSQLGEAGLYKGSHSALFTLGSGLRPMASLGGADPPEMLPGRGVQKLLLDQGRFWWSSDRSSGEIRARTPREKTTVDRQRVRVREMWQTVCAGAKDVQL